MIHSSLIASHQRYMYMYMYIINIILKLFLQNESDNKLPSPPNKLVNFIIVIIVINIIGIQTLPDWHEG